MIQGFSEQTKPLTDYEDKVILPLIVQGLHGKVGKSKAITNKAMCSALKSYGCKIDSPRIRKIINHIRLSGMVIGLIATSEGYYIAETRKELEDYLRSLEGREGAIHAVRKSLEKQLQLYDKYSFDRKEGSTIQPQTIIRLVFSFGRWDLPGNSEKG